MERDDWQAWARALTEDRRLEAEERAAIIEYDAGQPRREAERLARWWLSRQWGPGEAGPGDVP